MRAYRRLFALPGVTRQAVVAVISRTTPPVLSLTLLAAVHAEYGDYVLGSLLVGLFSVSFAVAMPLTGRLTDAHSPRRVLRACLAVNILAYAGIITSLVNHAAEAALIALAVLLGASLPPVGAVTRSGWAILVPAPDLRTAFALDTAINEAATVLGPLLAAVVIATVPLPAGMALAAVAACVGSLGLPGPVLAARRHEAAAPSPGPLGSPRTPVLLAIALCTSFTAGAAVIAATATATSLGRASAAGILLAVLGIGAVASATAYGIRPPSGSPLTQLAALCGAGLTVFLAMAATCRSALTCSNADALPLLPLAALFLVLGLTAGPRDVIVQLLLTESTRPARRTEAFSWLATAGLTGFGLGTAVTGQVSDGPHGQILIFVAPAAAFAVAIGLHVLLRRAPT